ncbi:hypothetical protein GIB67_034518 [Kingdonia uniflora]|uniref:CCHC-type domain-containing protein n=1 Tax=Kingdonia uniflora TaxID=39325 RepID=A0A7J7PB58_9MAGN|nr:hypothetical protein GIB67_034518 [Kingdonia uniflora]
MNPWEWNRDSIPDDIALHIASSLKVSDVCALGSCSRLWRKLCSSDYIWLSLSRNRWPSLDFSKLSSASSTVIQSSDSIHEEKFSSAQSAKQTSELQAQSRPPVLAPTTTMPAIPTVTGPRTYVLGNCYGCGKPGHQKCDCPIFAKKVGLVIDGMRKSVIANVQRVLQDQNEDEEGIHTAFVHESSGAPPL